jgi:hypothetical protein
MVNFGLIRRTRRFAIWPRMYTIVYMELFHKDSFDFGIRDCKSYTNTVKKSYTFAGRILLERPGICLYD